MLPHEKRGAGEVSRFIFAEIAKYGGSNNPAAPVPVSGITNYLYSEDQDGFQVICDGNNIAALRSIFQARYGNPTLSTTNTNGVASFVYSVRQTGMAVNCGLEGGMVNDTRKELTHLVAVKAGVLK
jgi:hypothetical protein